MAWRRVALFLRARAVWQPAMTDPVELHFQEGFYGQHATVSVAGKPAMKLALTTALQTGLAHVATIDAGPGDRVTVTIDGTDQHVSHKLAKGESHVLVNHVDDRLTLRTATESPGYL